MLPAPSSPIVALSSSALGPRFRFATTTRFSLSLQVLGASRGGRGGSYGTCRIDRSLPLRLSAQKELRSSLGRTSVRLGACCLLLHAARLATT